MFLSDNKLTSNLIQTFVNLLFYFCNFTLSCQEMQRGVWKQQNSTQSKWYNKHTYSTLASIPLIPAVEQVAILVHCTMITCLIFLSGTALTINNDFFLSLFLLMYTVQEQIAERFMTVNILGVYFYSIRSIYNAFKPHLPLLDCLTLVNLN